MNLRELLANLQHEIWSDWMKWLFKCCAHNDDGSVTIPKEKVERWTRQMNTPYSQLSNEEQESDRTEADKTINLVNAATLPPKS